MIKRIIIFIFLLTVSVGIQAQSECESMLNAAKEYYQKNEYSKARTMFVQIQKTCNDKNYGGAEQYIKKCDAKIREKADYQKCTTIEACDYYLSTYPNGSYVSRVQKKRSELVDIKEEDDAFEKCKTEPACRSYLEKYPEGRYVEQVKIKLSDFVKERIRREEFIAYQHCTTEEACKAYLKKYPNGEYVELVTKKLAELERSRREEYIAYQHCTTIESCLDYLKKYPEGVYSSEVTAKMKEIKESNASKTAYMTIKKIEFANVDDKGNIIDAYGSTLYVSEMKYLKPKIVYDGMIEETKKVSLYCKLYNPKGSLESGENSPAGYTYSDSYWVWPGKDNKIYLSGWGNNSGGTFTSGKYTLELWYEGGRIYQTTITIKNKENALSRGEWRIALKKCCEYYTAVYEGGGYKGQLYDDSPSGYGMSKFNNESFYFGRWSSGELSGVGMVFAKSGHIINNCPDCEYFVGNFSGDRKSETGTCYDRFGNLIYYGNFVDDAPSQTYPTSGFNNYKFECFEYSNGNFYVGETLNGKCHGKGIYIWSNGDVWYGEWSDGQRDGSGVYMTYSGSVYSGRWKGDTKL